MNPTVPPRRAANCILASMNYHKFTISSFHTAASDVKRITNSQKKDGENIGRVSDEEGRRIPTLESMVPSLFSDSGTPSGGATIDDGRILRIRPPNHQSMPPPTVALANPEPQRLQAHRSRSIRRGSHRRSGSVAGAHGDGEGFFFLFRRREEKHEIVTCYRILPL